MNYSDFGRHFSGHFGVTQLMADLSEGLLQDNTVMLGGGNPAAIPAVTSAFEQTLGQLLGSGDLIEALANYDGPQGNTAFIDTLADFFKRHHGWNIGRKNIALTHGSQSTFFILFNSFAGRTRGKNQKILIPLVPEYIGYCDVGIEDSMIVSQQAKIKHLADSYFKYEVDFEHLAVGADIGLICVSRPTNPSGNVLTDLECEHLDQVAKKNDIPLLIDSAYGTPFPNIIFDQVNPFWNDNTIVCMSLSKLGLPGVRTGIVIANEEVIEQFTNMTAITSLAPAGIGPAIVNRLIKDKRLLPLCNDVILPFYQQRSLFAANLIKSRIDDPRLHIHKPEGALFLWLWFEGLPVTTTELYHSLKSKGLIVVPGKYFFPGQKAPSAHGESCIRMNFIQSEEDLEKGVSILADELRRYWGS